jgi:hypothetical protein
VTSSIRHFPDRIEIRDKSRLGALTTVIHLDGKSRAVYSTDCGNVKTKGRMLRWEDLGDGLGSFPPPTSLTPEMLEGACVRTHATLPGGRGRMLDYRRLLSPNEFQWTTEFFREGESVPAVRIVRFSTRLAAGEPFVSVVR